MPCKGCRGYKCPACLNPSRSKGIETWLLLGAIVCAAAVYFLVR